jgi:rubrerythrin
VTIPLMVYYPPKTMDLFQKLEACLKVELLCEEIYYSMCNLFPEAKKLFRQLAEEEERHADILTICSGFHKLGVMPDIIVPDSAPKIKESLELAEEMRQKVIEETLSLREALQMALDLEESVAEIYFNELMTEQSEEGIISHLQKYYKDEIPHTERIKQYILTLL